MPLVIRNELGVDSAESLRGLAAEWIDRAQSGAEADALDPISCRAGCTACCHQAVPVGPTELAALVGAIERLPDEARGRIRQQIDDAGRRLRALGFSSDDPITIVGPQRTDWARRYFDAGVPCPLLDGDTCALRDERPLVCRDYLVTSDPEHCRSFDGEKIVRIRAGRDVVAGFARHEASLGRRGSHVLALALSEPVPELDAFEPMSLDTALETLLPKLQPQAD